ncbi:SET domain-containing protein 4-like isoform X2 [Branchiostoma floridae]|uniref:SET domain-containing protein 4-like isoform X2 n=1 Tax=Branchiostoma floridae TaxID=7739 RepID=A0A9J7LPT1_BRAFL|nr:SET domain-containing protein 4-like isoform X2 [Branchiostoma floridae]XP_035686978.1 SET domain-containing protein 4-like isoform X2 [Branchiostoma floridae]
MTKRGRSWRDRRRKSKQKEEGVRHASLMSRDDSIQLMRWLRRNGFRDSHLVLTDFPDTGRGVMSTRNLKEGDCIVSLPENLLITTTTVVNSHLGQYIKTWKPRLTPKQVLSLYLIAEKSRGKDSFWYPYIQTLPTSYTTPSYFSTAEVDALPALVREATLRHRKVLQNSYKSLQTSLHNLEPLFPDWKTVFTLKSYRWAWATVYTRSVYKRGPGWEFLDPSDPDVYALAPFLDMLNHSPLVQTDTDFNVSSKCYEVKTEGACRKYRQVFINYDPYDNGRLLMEYGFVMPRNPHSVVTFTADDVVACLAVKQNGLSSKNLLQKKMELLSQENLTVNLSCSGEGLSWRLQTALQVLCMDHDSICNWRTVLRQTPRDPTLWSTARLVAQRLISKRLEQHSSRTQVAEKILDPGNSLISLFILMLLREDLYILEHSLKELNSHTAGALEK